MGCNGIANVTQLQKLFGMLTITQLKNQLRDAAQLSLNMFNGLYFEVCSGSGNAINE